MSTTLPFIGFSSSLCVVGCDIGGEYNSRNSVQSAHEHVEGSNLVPEMKEV